MLRIQDDTGDDLEFECTLCTPFNTIILGYWTHRDLQGDSHLLFKVNGSSVNWSDTPLSLGLVDGDVIYASVTSRASGQTVIPSIHRSVAEPPS